MSVLILDGHLKSSLAVVRSLGKAGEFVVCGGERRTAMALSSRYAKERFVYVSPKINQQGFVDAVRTEASRLLEETGERPVVFCFSDATHLSLARAYSQLKDVLVFPLPPHEPREVAFDKEKTHTYAETLNIPTIRCYQPSEFLEVAFPAVVKARHSMVWKEGKGIAGTAVFVFSYEELVSVFKKVKEETGESPLVQEFIEGDEYGVECVCKGGRILEQFSHKRIRSLSPRGGAAVVKETAPDSKEAELMRRYAEVLLHELQWTGPAMVEFKIDNRDGSIRLMEINGRFWGSLPLAIHAGAHFPLVYMKLAEGIEVKNKNIFVPSYVRTRHFLGDVKWLLTVLFANDQLRKQLYPSRLKAIWDFKIEICRSRGDIFDIRDLKPSFMEYIDILRK